MLNFAPTIGYCFFIAIPGFLNAYILSAEYSYEFFYFSLGVLFFLFCVDLFFFRIEGKKYSKKDFTKIIVSKPIVYSSIIFIILSLLINVVLHDGIPLLDSWWGSSYSETRAFHAKSSNLFYYSSYLINFCNFLFIPLVFFALAESSNIKGLIITSPLFILSYSFYLNLFAIIFFFSFVFMFYVSVKTELKIYRWLMLFVVCISVVSLYKHSDSIQNYALNEPNKIYSIADVYRKDEGDSIFAKIEGKVVYRLVLVPSDVAMSWFRYFHESDSEIGEGYNVNYPNLIGVKYYVGRYKDKYTGDISAFTSFDTDSLVRFGVGGLMFFLVMWILMRLLISYILTVCGSQLLHGYILISAAIFLPMASMPAFALSNGFLFGVLALLLLCRNGCIQFLNAKEFLKSQD